VKLSKEFKVGALALLCFGLLYYGFNFLKGVNFFAPAHQYVIMYDKVDGLTESNPVQINGLTIGRVRTIRIVPEKNFQLAVTIDVNKDITITDSTVAYLSSTGVLGPKDIILKIGKGTKILQSGDTIPTGEIEDMMSMISKKAKPLADSVEYTIQYLNKMLKEYGEMGSEIKKILQNTQSMTASFGGIAADNRQNIKLTMDNAAKMSSALAESQKKLDPMLAKFNTFADSLNALKLASTVNKANSLVGEMSKMMLAINQQKGTAGKMIYNDSLYQNLNKSLTSLDSLLVDFRKSPKRYVHFSLFGKKEKK
jgi:phospholipid/cholesterol/gamma-HCH transport system substrate-binding protein